MNTGAMLVAAILVPLALATALAVPSWRGWVGRLTPFAPLPALAASLFGAIGESVVADTVLTGGLRLGLDGVGPVFLGFTALIWTAAAWHVRLDAALGGPRFLLCFLAAMGGNAGLVAALDPMGFYLFYSVMSIAAYGLVVHACDRPALAAGRLYLAIALLGEMLMMAGFMMLANGMSGVTVALLLYFGLGSKHAVLPLHMWLAPAHGYAPVPASALLSGAMLKAGFLGWLRFLPQAGEALADLTPWMIGAGLAAAFLAAAAGVMQARPKMVLAYSSISQMGLATVAAGVAASEPWNWAMLVPPMAFFALHHALTKAALFLGVGVARAGRSGQLVFPGLVVLALAIAAFPLTGGALAKLWLDQFGGRVPMLWDGILEWAMPLSSVASALVMGRFLWLVRPSVDGGEGVRAWPFLALLAAALAVPWAVLAAWHPDPLALALAPAHVWKALWPVSVGAVAVAAVWALAKGEGEPRQLLAPGDIAVPALAALRLLRGLPLRLPKPVPLDLLKEPLARVERAEAVLGRFGILGAAFLVLLIALALVSG